MTSKPAQGSLDTYEKIVQSIRRLRGEGTQCEVDAMVLVLDLETQPFLWSEGGILFEDVIRREKFCTVARWKAFKKARTLFTRKDRFLSTARLLGVAAICLIAVQSEKVRFRLLREATTYRDKYDIGPTYQYIAQRIGKKRTTPRPSRATLLRQNEKFKKDIAVLSGLLRKNKIKLPTTRG